MTGLREAMLFPEEIHVIYLGLSLLTSNWASTNNCRDACWLPGPPLPQPICLCRASRCSHHSFVGSLPFVGTQHASHVPVRLLSDSDPHLPCCLLYQLSPQPCHTLSLHLSPTLSEININFFLPNIGSWVKITSPLPIALKFRDVEIFNHSLILVLSSLSEALSCFTESFIVGVIVYFYNSCIMFMTGVILQIQHKNI